MLSVIIAATRNYQYALFAQARAIAQNAALARIERGSIILATDEAPVVPGLLERYKALLPSWEIHHLALPVKELTKKDYSANAQLLIAQLYSAAFDKARDLGAEFVWSLEADVIPEPNNLRCMRDMLAFDGGYYDVAFCPYSNGCIMGGHGSPTHWIFPNWYEDELALPDELKQQLKDHRAKHTGGQPSAEWFAELKRLEEEAKKHPPKGNVFKLNGERWRRRGWLEFAYPGIGKGAVVKSDWMPMGNNLFSARATSLVDFTGYTGGGTQDLYLSYRLAAHGLKFCVIPHSLSHHAKRKQNADGGPYTLHFLYHQEEGECVGHIRQREVPFYSHEPGERIEAQEPDYAI